MIKQNLNPTTPIIFYFIYFFLFCFVFIFIFFVLVFVEFVNCFLFLFLHLFFRRPIATCFILFLFSYVSWGCSHFPSFSKSPQSPICLKAAHCNQNQASENIIQPLHHSFSKAFKILERCFCDSCIHSLCLVVIQLSQRGTGWESLIVRRASPPGLNSRRVSPISRDSMISSDDDVPTTTQGPFRVKGTWSLCVKSTGTWIWPAWSSRTIAWRCAKNENGTFPADTLTTLSLPASLPLEITCTPTHIPHLTYVSHTAVTIQPSLSI